MKLAFIASCLAVAAEAAYRLDYYAHVRQRTGHAIHDTSDPDESSVPGYNFTIPVDHFDSSNKNTFPNRYFVNDTYYKAGGPVILFDVGEAAFDVEYVNQFLAESRSHSLPMQLAARINAVVIGWEHRYYGYSRPVPIDDESGFPEDGIKGYKYHTVEQALEDVAYFANRFNETKLDKNDIVRNGTGLSPKQVPWIFVGGSYSGSRATWMRVKYPDVIYASWASSAPLQYQVDGSGYYNPILRSMPRNCTDDIKAAIDYVDSAFTSGSDDTRALVKIGAYLLRRGDAPYDMDGVERISDFHAALLFSRSFTLFSTYQSYGTKMTSQMVCDFMQTFDVDSYDADMADANSAESKAKAILNNPGGKEAKAVGISSNKKGSEHSLAALVYANIQAKEQFNDFIESIRPPNVSEPITPDQDYASWEWQVISQLGVFQGSNPNNITAISKYYNFTAVENIQLKTELFGDFGVSALPKAINNKPILDLGGWDIEVSNVMFANGEFDPWRAFGVASQEEGAPKRQIVQDVPDCNKPPADKKIFGLVYPGAVHAEDILTSNYSSAALVRGKTPQEQGMELFLDAWKSWSACYSKERENSDKQSAAMGVKPFGFTALAAVVALFLYN